MVYFIGILMLICLFLRLVFIEIFYGYILGYLKIKCYENDMVMVFLNIIYDFLYKRCNEFQLMFYGVWIIFFIGRFYNLIQRKSYLVV